MLVPDEEVTKLLIQTRNSRDNWFRREMSLKDERDVEWKAVARHSNKEVAKCDLLIGCLEELLTHRGVPLPAVQVDL